MKGIGMNKFFGMCAAATLVAGSMLQGCVVPWQAHTQEFAAGQNNLQGHQLYFIPTPGVDGYQRMVVDITAVGNDPTGDTVADVNAAVKASRVAEAVLVVVGDLDEIREPIEAAVKGEWTVLD